MAKLNLDLTKLTVETFSVDPPDGESRYGSSDWCDTDRECSSLCLHATNVCQACG